MGGGLEARAHSLERTAGRRRTRRAVVVGLGAVVAALGAVVVIQALGHDDASSACGRSAPAPDGGTVQTVAQGAQLTVGGERLGIGGLTGDGCTLRTFGDVTALEVGERVQVGGVPVVLLSVEPSGSDAGGVGGAFAVRVWVGEPT